MKAFAFPLDELPDPRVGAFVRRFCRASPSGEDVRLATAFLDLLRKWKVNGLGEADVKQRPDLVFHAFTGFLSPSPFETRLKQETIESLFLTGHLHMREVAALRPKTGDPASRGDGSVQDHVSGFSEGSWRLGE